MVAALNYSYKVLLGVPHSPIFSSQVDTVQSHLLEYNITWSTLTLSPIVEYLVMNRIYQVKKNSWRIITVPERKLPRVFILTASHTLRWLEPYISYGQGEWLKLIHFSLNRKGRTYFVQLK